MWQKFRVITLGDYPSLEGKEIWVEVSPPQGYTGLNINGERINLLGYKTNIIILPYKNQAIIGRNSGELLPIFQDAVGIVTLQKE